MSLLPYNALPAFLKTPEGAALHQSLQGKKGQLLLKRLFDIAGATGLLLALAPLLLGVGAWVGCTSPGGVLFHQERVGRYGKPFRIHKFRTMTAGEGGSGVTTDGDSRVTPSGQLLRRYRLDELPQLLNILLGEMSFVGPRPELPKFVACYTPAMLATLLLPVGLTCPASIAYREEAALLGEKDPEGDYRSVILPQKMAYNLKYAEDFSFFGDLAVLFETIKTVWGE